MMEPAVHPLSPSLHPPRRSASFNLSSAFYSDPSSSRSPSSMSPSPSPSPGVTPIAVAPHGASSSSMKTPAPALGGYFDIPPVTSQGTRAENSGIGLGFTLNVDEDDLMGVVSGSNGSRRHSSSGEMSTVKPKPKAKGKGRGNDWDWAKYVNSLSRDELDILEQRYDLMDEEQLRALLEDRERHANERQTGQKGLSLVNDSIVETQTPRPLLKRLSTVDDRSNTRDQPLFPPSPPELAIVPTSPERAERIRNVGRRNAEEDAGELGESYGYCSAHPLSVLTRAVREMKEIIVRLEVENAELKERLKERGISERHEIDQTGQADKVDQASIHDGLTEALSTSLTSPNRDFPLRAVCSVRSTSPFPTSVTASTLALDISRSRSTSRPKSPSSALSLPVEHDSGLLRGESSSPNPNRGSSGKGKSSWWGWSGSATGPNYGSGNGRKAPTRKMSGSSLATSSVLKSNNEMDDDEEEDDKELDEHAFRRGDGGSAPSFRAIFLATRILTPDPSSILISTASPISQVAKLAHDLVSTARDQGIVAHDVAELRRERSRSRAASNASRRPQIDPAAKDKSADQDKEREDKNGHWGGVGSDSALAATVSMGRALLSSVSNATIRGRHAINTLSEDLTSRPSLLNRASSSRPFPTTAVSRITPAPESPTSDEEPAVPVELASIVPDEARPPTFLLSRQNLGSFFQSNRTPKMITATRFTADEPPLTDRYGFIYDIQHARMLKDASAAGALAPASLNGHVPEAPTEGAEWIERRRRSVGTDRPAGESSSESESTVPLPRRNSNLERTPSSNEGSHQNTMRYRKRGATLLTLKPSPARPTSAKDSLVVSARGSSSLQSVSTSSPLSATLSHPSPSIFENVPTPSASRLTVSSLLDQLTDMHDRQQAARMVEWDSFLRRRSASLGKGRGRDDLRWSSGLIGIAQMGRSKSGLDEYRQFLRLVRAGIPLAYRSDVWAECSGAKDSLVPGEYEEILTVHKDDICPFSKDIEKDVGRTFPGNIFFGGDGPGVNKLRRVLTAYAWHNPAVGYCQGMNMLAATLLLTHTDEEQAYWTLLCMIERLLPKDFFSASLVGSRADQAVLNDLVVEHVPRVHAHLVKLGVDLASITFGWFLSLFTDCLPVDTLFCVWDVFFVEGHDTLFRVALSIIKLNENELCATDSVSDLFLLIGGMTSRLWFADKLISLQHSLKTTIKHADIAALYQKHLNELQAAEE